MKEQKTSLSVRELALFLGVRLMTAYGLLWDRTIAGEKENGVWVADRKSAEAYRQKQLSRHLRTDRRVQKSSYTEAVAV